MADTTISFKVEDELREKAQNLIKISGITAKEWFQKAVTMAEMQSVKEGATDYASDLGELEIHTTRIFELVSNMVQKSNYLKSKAVGDLENLLDQQRNITLSIQSKLHEISEQKEKVMGDLRVSQDEQIELEKKMAELQESLETKKLLISEYKEKNDTLTGLVAKYEAHANENESLKETLANERGKHQLQVTDLIRKIAEYESKIKAFEQQKNRLIEAHKMALNRIEERKDIEQEKALLALERGHQKALTNANNEYDEKVKELFINMDKQRQLYEKKIETLQSKAEVSQTYSHK